MRLNIGMPVVGTDLYNVTFDMSLREVYVRVGATVQQLPLQYSALFALRQSRVDLMTSQTTD